MTDAGFFRGTSADQDNRFANKQKKLLKELNLSPILTTKLNMSKIDLVGLKPWIENKIKDVLEKDDDILSEAIYEHLKDKEPDGRNLQVMINGFVEDSKASKFMEELWTKLIDLQDNSNGVSKPAINENPDSEDKPEDNHGEETTKTDKLNESNNNSNEDHPRKESPAEHRSAGSSHSVSPPSRSVSKSPGNHKLDERSRGRPRKRLQDEASKDNSNSPVPERRKSRSRSRSSSHSARSAGASRRSPTKVGEGEPRKRSRSSSRSRRSRSGSRSRSYSRSRSRSSSRSRSRTPRRRSRSPYSHSYRGRRSRSHSRGYRPRSRSPRGRRGFGPRGTSYRGSYGFNDRRRGGMSGPMRRRSPWGRRRFSPRSPLRRRRSPSFSPRRRRSPSPYNRRISRSRSPHGHMMNRNIQSPRSHNAPGGGHLDMMGGRHGPHHDSHRQVVPLTRSPRGPLDHRGYGDGQLLPRHSPGPVMNKPPDLPPTSHGLISNQPGPSGSGLYSPPSSGRKKHKKEKKHRKHKKSKKHRSESPEKKKKHKKHKKTKKHNSH